MELVLGAIENPATVRVSLILVNQAVFGGKLPLQCYGFEDQKVLSNLFLDSPEFVQNA